MVDRGVLEYRLREQESDNGMMKSAIISQRVEFIERRVEHLDCLDVRWTKMLWTLGYLAHPIPNKFPDYQNEACVFEFCKAIRPRLILLSGGNDWGSVVFRDRTEMALLDYAEAFRVPVLGICRGMQIMAIRAGGSLHRVAGHAGVVHGLQGASSRRVNSFHRYSLESCPPQYKVTFRSEDGEIEGINHSSLPWMGIMWHPERCEPFDNEDINLLSEYFEI